MVPISCLMTTAKGVVPLKLLLAATPQEQQQGYKGRPPPPDDHSGILFFFPAPTPAVFTMEGVPFDLELVAGGADGTVLGGCHMQANNPIPYRSAGPIRFAVELKPGWSTRNGQPVRMTLP